MSKIPGTVPLFRLWVALMLSFLLAACLPPYSESGVAVKDALTPEPVITATALPTRRMYAPGELVEYIAQTGDTLPALAAHFNTTVEEIRAANPQIPEDATTMPPGMPMQIPIYYLPLWGTPFQILPDSLFVNGPAIVGFDTSAFVNSRPGWLKDFAQYAGGQNRTGAQIVDYVATNFSLSPRLLLALLEYESGALSRAELPDTEYLFGYRSYYYRGFYMQLVWAANMLNHGYYGWRSGRLTEFEHPDGRLERPDPWQNAATVALQYYFSRLHNKEAYDQAVGPQGFAKTYQALFGDPWQNDQPHIPVSLMQPPLRLPFPNGKTWAFTSGPHNPWGRDELDPLAALDFAPSFGSGCEPSDEPVVAMADGVIVRTAPGVLVLDLDGDGKERTGWVIFYLHIAHQGKWTPGTFVHAGEALGFPSCEGGYATGTHVHVARKYNGEWIPADGALAFDLEGWIAHNGALPRQGWLQRGTQTVVAGENATAASQLTAGR